MSTGAGILDADDLTALSSITSSRDPMDAYNRLQDVHGMVAPVQLEPGLNAWLVTGWEEIREVVRNPRAFSRDPNNWGDWQQGNVPLDSGLGPMMFPRANAYFVDGPEHYRLRAPLDDGIRDIKQRRLRETVARMCEGLIEGFAGRGEADLVAEYAAVIPMLAVASLFGLDVARGHELQQAIIALFSSGEGAQAGNRVFERIIGECISSHRKKPTGDMTTAFLDHPNLRDDGEVAQSIVLMVSAGYETTTAWISRALQLMLTDDRFLGRAGIWRPGVNDALHDVLWKEPPMANMPARYSLIDTELAGQRIRRGDAIILGLLAAGNDPRIHVGNPWTELGNKSYLAWSTGPHACPARVPAEIITRTAVDVALNRLAGLTLGVPKEQLSIRPSPWTRCPASLPVRFTS